MLSGATITVDDDGPADFNSIQAAIDVSQHFDTIVVHPGVYIEKIYYNAKAITITSMDPNNPDIIDDTVIDGNGAGSVVSFIKGETPFSILRGLAIRNGSVGIDCEGVFTKPLIENCVITNNSIGLKGGSAKVSNCEISENTFDGVRDSTGTLLSCIISRNGRAGIKNKYQSISISKETIILLQCMIYDNMEEGVRCEDGHAAISNCIVSENGKNGLHFTHCSSNIDNCTIVGNKGDGVSDWGATVIRVLNSVIAWNHGHGLAEQMVGQSIISKHNNIYANASGQYRAVDHSQYDIHEHPFFKQSGFWDKDDSWHQGDYHLMSTIGRWDPTTESWVTDPIDSPCLDMGDPNMPFGDESYPHGGRLNLGAYGGTPEASMSEVPGPVCVEYPEMDFNQDCKVDQLDLDLFMEHWLECNLDDPNACVFVTE